VLQLGLVRTTIVIVAFTHIDRDVRVLRQIKSLAVSVDVVTIGYGLQPPGVAKHFQIPPSLKYLPISFKSIVLLAIRRYDDALRFTPAYAWTTKVLSDFRPDIVYLNDVQTIGLVSQSVSTPTVVDMHEYAPLEMEDDWRFRLLLMRYYTFLCKRYLPMASKVVTVSPGLASKYQSEFGIEVETIMNARAEVKASTLENLSSDETIRLVHTGLAASGRHLEWMIEAIGDLPGVSLDLYLVEAPRQSRTLKSLKKLTAKYENCSVKPPVPPSELPSKISEYDAGLVFIAPSNFSLRHCMPNKLFDCIQARRPVIVGPSPDMADFVKKHDIGFVCPSFDVDDLRKTLMGISRADLDLRSESLDRTAISINEESEGLKLRDIVLSAMK
jgi:glycosyltransferase involved in cell wall biosynthesis